MLDIMLHLAFNKKNLQLAAMPAIKLKTLKIASPHDSRVVWDVAIATVQGAGTFNHMRVIVDGVMFHFPAGIDETTVVTLAIAVVTGDYN